MTPFHLENYYNLGRELTIYDLPKKQDHAAASDSQISPTIKNNMLQ